MGMTTALGLLAGTLTTVAFLPQVIRIWKSKSVTAGVVCWMI